MPYTQRIKTLEESHRLAENQLFQLEKADSKDSDKIKSLREAKQKYLNELQHLRRAQWDHDHESVDFGDDR